MKKNSHIQRRAGFTLVELSVTLGVATIVGGIAYSMLISSTTLLAKNMSINTSSITVRSALDRMYSDLNQARMTTEQLQGILVNANGTPTGSTAPAAGIIFDRYVGGPYVVGNPGSGLPANATTFKLFYSTHALANPPAPVNNDVVIMDGSTRLVVGCPTSCTATTSLTSPIPNPAPTSGKMATVSLPASKNVGSYTTPTGSGIPWSSGTQQTAYLVHREAFIVVPHATNGTAELRMYPDAENLTTSIINDTTKYVVLTRSIGTKTVSGQLEHTPFSLVTKDAGNRALDATHLKISMRVEDQQYNKRLNDLQANEFNTFLRVDSLFRPKNVL